MNLNKLIIFANDENYILENIETNEVIVGNKINTFDFGLVCSAVAKLE